MIWFGLLTGVILGFSFESFPLGLLFTIIGGFGGWLLNRRRKQDGQLLAALKQRLEHVEAHAVELAKQLEALEAYPGLRQRHQEGMRRLQHRLIALLPMPR